MGTTLGITAGLPLSTPPIVGIGTLEATETNTRVGESLQSRCSFCRCQLHAALATVYLLEFRLRELAADAVYGQAVVALKLLHRGLKRSEEHTSELQSLRHL